MGQKAERAVVVMAQVAAAEMDMLARLAVAVAEVVAEVRRSGTCSPCNQSHKDRRQNQRQAPHRRRRHRRNRCTHPSS